MTKSNPLRLPDEVTIIQDSGDIIYEEPGQKLPLWEVVSHPKEKKCKARNDLSENSK